MLPIHMLTRRIRARIRTTMATIAVTRMPMAGAIPTSDLDIGAAGDIGAMDTVTVVDTVMAVATVMGGDMVMAVDTATAEDTGAVTSRGREWELSPEPEAGLVAGAVVLPAVAEVVVAAGDNCTKLGYKAAPFVGSRFFHGF